MPIINTVIQGGGSSPTINPLPVTPTTSAQTITAPSGVDGYNPVSVSAVTAAIDSNIQAGNIKSGVSILGVTGSYSGGLPEGKLPAYYNYNYPSGNYHTTYQALLDDMDFSTLSVGDIVKLYTKAGVETNTYNPVYGTTLTAPFTFVSATLDGKLWKIYLKDTNNINFGVGCIKRESCFTVYCDATTKMEGWRIIAPTCPKVGDEIPQKTTAYGAAYILTSSSHELPGYDTANLFGYIDASRNIRNASGPITVAEVFYIDGYQAIKLQDRNGNILNNSWMTAIPEGTLYVTDNNQSFDCAYYSSVQVDVPIPTPTSSGGSFVPLVMTTQGGVGMPMNCKRMPEGGAGSYYMWEDQNNGGIYYTRPWTGIIEDWSVYDYWTVVGSSPDLVENVYGGGFKTDMNEVWAIKNLDPVSGDIEYINAQGTTQILSGYGHSLPQVGGMTPMGIVAEVYDSTLPIPVVIQGQQEKWYYSHTDDIAGRMVFDNNNGVECYIYGTKFYGMADYTLYDDMDMAFDTIMNGRDSYYYMYFEMNGDRFVDGHGGAGNAQTFYSHIGTAVYVPINSVLGVGTPVYSDYQLTNQIGSIDNIVFAQ